MMHISKCCSHWACNFTVGASDSKKLSKVMPKTQNITERKALRDVTSGTSTSRKHLLANSCFNSELHQSEGPVKRKQRRAEKGCVWLSQAVAGLEKQLCELTAEGDGAAQQPSLAPLAEPRHFHSWQKYAGIKQHDAGAKLTFNSQPRVGTSYSMRAVALVDGVYILKWLLKRVSQLQSRNVLFHFLHFSWGWSVRAGLHRACAN